MGIRHAVPAGLPTGTVTGKVAGDDWRSDHNHVPFEVPLLLAGSAALTPAPVSATANTEVLAAVKPTRNLVDLSNASQGRLVAVVIATGNVVGASLKLSYMTTNAATWAGADAGPVVVLGTNGGAAGIIHDSGWVNLVAGAKVDNCYLAALVGTAFGTTAPTVGGLSLFLR